MSSNSATDARRKPVFEDSLEDALRVGLASGTAGFLIGGTAGILKNTTPVLFGIASSLQCAGLGSAFWLSRSEILRAWDQQTPTSATLTQASAIAGGLSGGLSALLFRGPRNVLPGVICISVLGAGGQYIYNGFTRKAAASEVKPKLWESITNAKWSPLRSIKDEDYIERLREQLLKYHAEIAVLDDKIAALRLQNNKPPVELEKQKEK